MSKKTRVLLIGAGNMGSALGRGLKNQASECELLIHDQHEQRSTGLAEKSRGSVVADLSSGSVKKAAEGANLGVVLCVKPHDLPVVAESIAGSIPKGAAVISILAGIPISEIRKELKLDKSTTIIRAMPNIAATVGQAATVLCCETDLPAEHRALGDMLFGSVGTVHWAPERLLDAVTGLSGSGPAYIYMVVEALTDGGVKMGIPRELSRSLAVQTVLGAGALIKESGVHPAVLRENVTTPGGTTIHAIHQLEERGLRAMIMHAVETATNQSTALNNK